MITLRLPQELAQELERQAAEETRTLSQQVVHVLKKGLKE